MAHGSRQGFVLPWGVLAGREDFGAMLTTFVQFAWGRRAGADLLRAAIAAGVVVALATGWRVG
jgi:hypothetical protein